jgi:hypothetical protein
VQLVLQPQIPGSEIGAIDGVAIPGEFHNELVERLADDRSRRATLGRCLYLGASPPARYVAHHDGGMGSLPGRRSRLLEMCNGSGCWTAFGEK